jgi:hypothetical protein
MLRNSYSLLSVRNTTAVQCAMLSHASNMAGMGVGTAFHETCLHHGPLYGYVLFASFSKNLAGGP